MLGSNDWETHRQELFANFTREVKLLHQVLHRNVIPVEPITGDDIPF